MMNKEKTCVIISSYPQSNIDNSLLSLTIESWTQQGYDILLATHSPVPQDIQKAVKYYEESEANYGRDKNSSFKLRRNDWLV